jgi:hypothetical protein
MDVADHDSNRDEINPDEINPDEINPGGKDGNNGGRRSIRLSGERTGD